MNGRVLAAALRVRTLQAKLAARVLADAGRTAAAERGREQARRKRLRAEVQAWHDGGGEVAEQGGAAWLPALLGQAEQAKGELVHAEQAALAARWDNARAVREQEVVEEALARARDMAAARAEQRAQHDRDDAGRARYHAKSWNRA